MQIVVVYSEGDVVWITHQIIGLIRWHGARELGPMMSGRVEWVNAMSVVYSGAWVGGVQIGMEEERNRWREMERETQRKKIVK